MNKLVLIGLLSCVTATAIAAQTPPTPAGQPVTKKTTLVGELEKGRLAIGGETTGWVLHYQGDAKRQTIEVDFGKAFTATARHGATVRLTGTIVPRQYVERGTVSTFVVSKLEELVAPK